MSLARVSLASPSNHILLALSLEERNRLLPELKRVQWSVGEVVYEQGERIDYVYFPTTSVVSLLCTMEDGSTTEVGISGNDGLIGLAPFLGGKCNLNRTIVEVAGSAFKVPAELGINEFARGGVFQDMILLFTQALIAQISQTAACNRLHNMEQRLSRWLLLTLDRTQSAELMLTQEFIAHMFGGRRESVTIAAGQLQDAGVIRYSRGHIIIVDRARLQAASCECYRTIKDETDHLLCGRRQPRAERFHVVNR